MPYYYLVTDISANALSADIVFFNAVHLWWEQSSCHIYGWRTVYYLPKLKVEEIKILTRSFSQMGCLHCLLLLVSRIVTFINSLEDVTKKWMEIAPHLKCHISQEFAFSIATWILAGLWCITYKLMGVGLLINIFELLQMQVRRENTWTGNLFHFLLWFLLTCSLSVPQTSLTNRILKQSLGSNH